jgi:hypothetical protein
LASASSPPVRILGIDPGISGALALLTAPAELDVRDMPTLEIERRGKAKRAIDAGALASAGEAA